MMPRSDWFTYADTEDVAKEYNAGPQDLDEIKPGVWGYKGLGVVCLGDKAHMRKIQVKRFNDKFHKKTCPIGYYGEKHGGPPLLSVFERLAPILKGGK
jgi:hypothetical protein